MIEMQGVYKRLDRKDVLAGLDLEVLPRETLVILGRSGTGKSVTLRHIVGLMTADRGTVRVFGVDLGKASPAELRECRRRIGYLFQDGALLNWITVGQNVALPLQETRLLPKREIQERVAECLGEVELLDAIDKYPSEISGGMRKRAGLARALATRPEVVLYDEPTSGLDPISSNIINRLINTLKSKLHVTQVVVTHDMNAAYVIGDRLALLHEGRIHAIGTAREFQESDDPAVVQFTRGEIDGPLSRTAAGAPALLAPHKGGQTTTVISHGKESR
ncbi:MAG: ATP-binding cassette domain-containing protein [Planctomycetes bacterium]|nr:ATP-binding cassette domain-containing protein [Planctomycetota bacterium]